MAEEAVAEAAPKGSKKLVIILGVVIVLLVAALGGGAAWYFMSADEAPSEEAQVAVQTKKPEAIYVQLRTLGGKPSFIVNFYEDSGRQRFLQIFASARTREESSAEALRKHMPLVVHSLTTLFSSQSFTDIQTAEGKERLRVQATAKVQEILENEIGKPGIEDVFFTNFVMQ